MKFFNLLKKELAELINAQMIISLVVVIGLLMALGNVMNTTLKEAVKQEYTVTICDRDKTEFTGQLIDTLRSNGATVNEITSDSEDYSELLDIADKDSLVIIPVGFSDTLESGNAPELISIARMQSSAMLANMSNNNDGATNFIKKCISNTFAQKAGLTEEDVALINSPIKVNEHTVIAEKSANISASTIMTDVMMKNTFLPIVVFCLIIMTSQALMNSISSEKIDKTLETLLSTPVSRTSILAAKMLAAATVALLNAACFMFGFSSMMSGATDSALSTIDTSALITDYIPIDTAMEQLGLNLGAGDYLLLGAQLFLTIMICLALSLMLGALINDPKQSQTMLLPLMIGAMVPYMISMFADINTLPVVIRYIVYAIPFTHTFSAIPNLMFGHTGIFVAGLVYQFIIFLLCMFFAVRLFNSDKILTISLNFGQKSKYKKNKKNSE